MTLPSVGLGPARGAPAPVAAPGRAQRPRLLNLHRLLAIVLIASAFVGLPRRMDFGPISGLGALSVAEVVLLAVGVVICARYPKSVLTRLLPIGCFLLWAGLSGLWAPPTSEGLQNATVYLLFGLALLLAGSLARQNPPAMEHLLLRTVPWIDRITLTLVFRDVLVNGLPNDPDEGWLIGPRPLAVLALMMLSWHLSRWYFDSQRSRLQIVLWMLAIIMSMSRTGMGVSLLLVGVIVLLQARFRPRHAAVTAPMLGGVFACVVALIVFSSDFNDRFFAGAHTQKFNVGGLGINTSGRINMWSITIESGRHAPIIGQGLGSSQQVVTKTFPSLAHPHNDYLRIWHDLGAVGLGFLLLAFLSWLYVLFRAWHRAEKSRSRPAHLELTAMLILIAIMLVMVPDNVIVYAFIMGPTGVFVGAALGTASAYAHARTVPRTPSASRAAWPPPRAPISAGGAGRPRDGRTGS